VFENQGTDRSNHRRSCRHRKEQLESIKVTSSNSVKCIKGNIAGSTSRYSLTEKVNLGDYHLIIIYYYERSSVFELNIAIPQETNVYKYICNNKIHIKCEDSHLTEFLLRKLKNVSKVEKRKLCLKIAKFCGSGQIRSLHAIDNLYNCKTFIAEVEVGSLMD
jgi:hypothetical protein